MPSVHVVLISGKMISDSVSGPGVAIMTLMRTWAGEGRIGEKEAELRELRRHMEGLAGERENAESVWTGAF